MAILVSNLQQTGGVKLTQIEVRVRPHALERVETEVTIFDLEVSPQGSVLTATLVSGDPEIVEPARRAFSGWRFSGMPSAIVHVSAVFLFRSGHIVTGSVKAFNAQVPDAYAKYHRAPFPVRIVEPGYRMGGTASGTVVLQLELSPEGTVNRVDPILDDPTLTPSAAAAAGNWTFFIPNRHTSPQIAIAIIHFAPQAEVTPLFKGFE
jgi:hypothetical protein